MLVHLLVHLLIQLLRESVTVHHNPEFARLGKTAAVMSHQPAQDHATNSQDVSSELEHC